MSKIERLILKQKKLKKEITKSLDILMGSVVKSPTMSGYALTDKIKGKTVTRGIHKSILKKAIQMTRNHKKVRKLLRQLSAVNLEILRSQKDME